MQSIPLPQLPAALNPQVISSQADAENKQDKITRLELISIVVTVGLAVALSIFAKISFDHSQKISLALSLGGIGGLIHEMVQSGGKILFFERKLDGFYIGGIAGMILGAVAGLLIAHGLLSSSDLSEIGYQAFLAGLGLKGIVDAASGQPIPSGAKSMTTGQVLAVNQAINAPQQPQTLGVLRLPQPPSQAPQ